MRIPLLIVLIGACLAGCGQSPAPPAAANAAVPATASATTAPAAAPPASNAVGLAGQAGSYSCTGTYQGRLMWCLVFPASYRGGPVEGKRNCEIAPGSRFGATCSTDGLIGCCTTSGAVGPTENCYYQQGEFIDDPAKCAAQGGVWSVAP